MQTVKPSWFSGRRISRSLIGGCGLCLVLSVVVTDAHAAQREIVLWTFGGVTGESPFDALIEDASGNLYGTTSYGGANDDGTIFKLSPDGAISVLYAFRGEAHGDGQSPYAGVIADRKGNFYGTTLYGGSGTEGTVFELKETGTETVRASAGQPFAGVIRINGDLYGANSMGGASSDGSVFKLAQDGTLTTLHSFAGGTDGAVPVGGLVADKEGNLYGTTEWGGAGADCYTTAGCGIIYKISPDGTEKVLHALQNTHGNDGANPYAGLAFDTAGNLCGTTYQGGFHGYGTVFKLAPNGSESVVYSFRGGSDGAHPEAGVVLRNGKLYGTTVDGGAGAQCAATGCGTVFKVSPDRVGHLLYAFQGGSDGAHPYAALIADKTGYLYGTTSNGGDLNCGSGYGCGVVFRVTR